LAARDAGSGTVGTKAEGDNKMNYGYRDLIRPMDDVYTTDISLVASAIKVRTDGWAGLCDGKVRIPSHAAKAVHMYGRIRLIEMVIDKNDHNKAIISESPLSKYEGNGAFGPRIVSVRRCSFYDDAVMRERANTRLLTHWASRDWSYDWRGSPWSYIFPWIHPDAKKKYCSEMVETCYNEDGLSLTDFTLCRKPEGLIPPSDAWKSVRARDREGKFYNIDSVWRV
jgi:hypothetical protein